MEKNWASTGNHCLKKGRTTDIVLLYFNANLFLQFLQHSLAFHFICLPKSCSQFSSKIFCLHARLLIECYRSVANPVWVNLTTCLQQHKNKDSLPKTYCTVCMNTVTSSPSCKSCCIRAGIWNSFNKAPCKCKPNDFTV